MVWCGVVANMRFVVIIDVVMLFVVMAVVMIVVVMAVVMIADGGCNGRICDSY